MPAASYLVRKAPDFLFVIPVWVLTVVAFGGVFDDGEPEWEYLWDDRKNYVNNIRVHSLSLSNIYWAFTDGVVLGVYEPVSLIIKQLLHAFIAVDPRTYRVITLSVHAVNIFLAFHVSRRFLASVFDYEYYRQKLSAIISEKEKQLTVLTGKTAANNNVSERNVVGSPGMRKLKKSKKENDSSGLAANASSPENIKAQLKNTQAEISNLQMHEALSTIGCMLGTSVFAVHPFQAQIIGWISCLPYCLSCFFSLLSFNGYVAHRSCMREWRRSPRLQERAPPETEGSTYITSWFKQPWCITHDPTKKSVSADIGEAETWLLTIYKVFALIFYVMATFCKAPAVVLPLVYVIIDVFLYSSPPSVHEEGASILREALGTVGNVSRGHSYTGWSWLLPSRLASRFVSSDFPILWKLTMNAVKSQLLFFILTTFSILYLVGGNSKTILDPLSPWQKSQKAALALMWYISKFFFPSSLVAAVEMHSFSFLDHWEVAVSLVLVPYGTLAILAYSTSSTPRRLLACAWGVFIVLLLPSLGFIQHGRMFLAADRYMYIPLTMLGPIVGALTSAWYTATIVSELSIASKFVHAGGPIVIFGSGINARKESATRYFIDASFIFDQLSQSKNKKRRGQINDDSQNRKKGANVVISIMICLVCTALLALITLFTLSLTPSTLRYWRQTGLLWQRNVEIIPDSENAHVNLSGYYGSGARDLDKALFHAKTANALRPNHPKYQYNIGEIYRMMRRNEEAKEMFQSILQRGSPRWLKPEVHYSLGLTLRALGGIDASKRELTLAASLGKTQARSDLDELNQQTLHKKNRSN
mmetsp:Transcript_43464/g.132240  ORF Transcript_43464/g.132240 Transcript_43464/m.132240 type:complete len:815 (-) Transcript_43464:747-3191(-)